MAVARSDVKMVFPVFIVFRSFSDVRSSKTAKKQITKPSASQKRAYISQAEIPKRTLEEAIDLGAALNEHYNGEAAPHELAIATGKSPTSSVWPEITGAAVAYGITEGGCNAARIILGDLGRRIITPEEEGVEGIAKKEAALRPRILRQFFEKYDKGKFPKEAIGVNVLVSLGVPKSRALEVYQIAEKNGVFAGLLSQTSTGLYVALETKGRNVEVAATLTEEESESVEGQVVNALPSVKSAIPKKNSRVFITHGKDRQIVEQLKEILRFGKFEPVVAVEHETVSKPVPEKVMEDMRSCFAAVIHVEAEEELLDSAGSKVKKINDNVLIEIGAAMALYTKNFVLLVKKGIYLPSNLQGLYRCDYDGDKLDYEATMKLLKAFNEFA
jgi:predicted nucleotide-binding protein